MRLLLVGDSGSILSIELARAAAALIRRRDDVELVGVCDTARGRSGRGRAAPELAAAVVKPLFGTPHPLRRAILLARGLPGPVIRPEGADPNAPEFLARLARSERPDAALWLGSVTLAGPPLLASLGRSVNYHNGTLPDLRGLHATAWSVHDASETSGFAFHVMDEGVDTGPVLVAGQVPVPPTATTAEVEQAKTAAAIAALPALLDMLVRGEVGTPQRGAGSRHGSGDLRAAMVIGEAAALTRDELERRLRAFGHLWITLPAGTLPVTAVRPSRSEGPLTFSTADGELLAAHRLRFLPPPLYRVAAGLRRALRPRRARG